MKAAVVGTGNIARQHLAVLRTLSDVSIAAVCDLSPVAAEAAAERWGAAAWYTDHRSMLEAALPDVVHVTTPPGAHFQVAMDALDAGAHVLVEKPLAPELADVEALVGRAQLASRMLVEDYNYLFNRPLRRLLDLVASGEAGPVAHVEVTLCVDPADGGLADFVSHLASVAAAFAGPHRDVAVLRREPGELRAMVDGERATAAVVFSTSARPDAFAVRLHAARLRATAGLFEPTLVVEPARPELSRPLVPLVNGLGEAWSTGRSAVGGLWGKLNGGPGSYEGLWELVRRTYRAVAGGAPPPVSTEQVLAVNRLVADLSIPVPA